jgi:energy-coupling factor transport system permease protein
MFLKNVSAGIYYPGNSLLHRMQARTKLLLMLMLVVALVVADRFYWDFTPYFVALSLVIAGTACSRISWREIWRRLWLLTLIVLLSTCLLLILPVYAPDGSETLYAFPPLIFSAAFVQGLMLVLSPLIVGYLLLVLLPLPALRRPGFRRALRRLRYVTIFLALLLVPALIYAFFSQPAHSTPGLSYMITRNSLWYAWIFFAIFLILYPCSLLLTMTTSPVALIEGLTMLMLPLRWLRLPVDDFALMTLLALRFIPTLIEEVEQLVKAQAARGVSFGSGSLPERRQSVLALFVPFLRNTLRRASELATALDARGYQVDGSQTRLHEKPLGLIDYSALFIVGCLLLAILLV